MVVSSLYFDPSVHSSDLLRLSRFMAPYMAQAETGWYGVYEDTLSYKLGSLKETLMFGCLYIEKIPVI